MVRIILSEIEFNTDKRRKGSSLMIDAVVSIAIAALLSAFLLSMVANNQSISLGIGSIFSDAVGQKGLQ